MANKKWGLLLVHTRALPPSLGPWQAPGEGQVSSSSSPTLVRGFLFPPPGFLVLFMSLLPECQPKYWAWPFDMHFAVTQALWPVQPWKAAAMWADLPSGAGAMEGLSSPGFKSSLLPSQLFGLG